jgi:histidine ammonia-lyase
MSSIFSIVVGERDLTIDDFYNVTVNRYQVKISEKSVEKIIQSRNTINKIMEEGAIVYGINTGFGSLSNKIISNADLDLLQYNLIVSHAVGCGDPAPHYIVRGMLLLRLTCICKGHSGVRIEVANKLVEALNKNYIPFVPKLGTVGASGDLAPLSHLILGLMGQGLAYCFKTNNYVSANEVMTDLSIEPLVLKAKEGLALNNGLQFITSYTALATYHANRLLNIANLVSALSLEALHGTHKAFDERIHMAKPHRGQIHVAHQLRQYLCPNGISEINQTYNKDKVQDAYSLRCIPQVHGASYDQIKFVEQIVTTEMNSANDNPLIFDNDVISGGNFHGQVISMAADNLALAMSYLCNISERRLDRMLNPALNKFLPSFLTEDVGLNSGLMILQYSSAAITAENRQLACPSSVHNIPTCQGCEDIISMGGQASRKAYDSVMNTYYVLAYELLTAWKAFCYTKEKPHEKLCNLLKYLKTNLPEIKNDTYMKNHFDFILNMLKDDALMQTFFC